MWKSIEQKNEKNMVEQKISYKIKSKKWKNFKWLILKNEYFGKKWTKKFN